MAASRQFVCWQACAKALKRKSYLHELETRKRSEVHTLVTHDIFVLDLRLQVLAVYAQLHDDMDGKPLQLKGGAHGRPE